MAYIGREPQVGNFQVCDAISVVNGQAAYTMQVNSVNVSPETANHMLVSLNGVLQAPTSSYTVSGSTITFASNLVTGDVINFIHILGSVLDLGVPSDSTVSLAKLTATGTKNSTTFLRGDNTFAEAGGGSLVKLASTTLSGASAGVAFNSTYVNSTYNNYYILINGILPVTDNADIGVYLSVDNGSNFATITSGNHYLGINTGGNGWQQNQNAHYVAHDCSNATGELKINGYALIENVNDTTCWKSIYGRGMTQNSGTKTTDYAYSSYSPSYATGPSHHRSCSHSYSYLYTSYPPPTHRKGQRLDSRSFLPIYR
jgi:hypothetical protein